VPPSARMQPTGRRCPELRPGVSSRWDAAERKLVRAQARSPAVMRMSLDGGASIIYQGHASGLIQQSARQQARGRYHLHDQSDYLSPTAYDILASSIRRATFGGPMHEIRRRRSSQRLAWTAVHWIVVLLTPVAARPVVGQAKPEVPDLSLVRSALEKYKDRPLPSVMDTSQRSAASNLSVLALLGMFPTCRVAWESTSSMSASSAPFRIPPNPKC
jgi:hypothetical protein